MDAQSKARLEELEETVARVDVTASGAAAALGGATLQRGTVTLVAGQATVPATITATSRVFTSLNTAAFGGGNTVDYETPTANRVVGAPGSFDIHAVTNTGVLQNLDVSSIDWLVVG